VRQYVGPKPQVLGPGDNIERLGTRRGVLRDVYARLLHARWRAVLALFAALYAALCGAFALAYWAVGDGIHGSDGSLVDAFAFSVHTLSTVGYGALSPESTIVRVLVLLQTYVGIIAVAAATGITFAKFARPVAGVMFSHRAVVTARNGRPALMFRVANERGSDVVAATIRVTALLNDVSQEGQHLRRLHNLKLLRDDSPMLPMSWLVIHEIDEQSPLYGIDAQGFEEGDVRILANLTGHDGTFSDTIYDNHIYWPEDVYFGSNFVDVVEVLPERKFRLDLSRFHDVTPPES